MALVLLLLTVSGCSLFGNAATSTPSDSPSASVSPSPSDVSPSPSDAEPAGTVGGDGILGSFTTTDLDGNEVTAAVFSGYKLTMVNVWTTTCGYCIEEMPELGELHRAYAEKGFQIVGIAADVLNSKGDVDPTRAQTAEDIIEATDATYMHLIPSEDLINTLLYRISGVPTTIFVDEFGAMVGEAIIGPNDLDGWMAIVDERLEEVG